MLEHFSDQLKYTDIWQPKRVYFNTSSWFYKTEEAFKNATEGKLTSVDVGSLLSVKRTIQ